MASPSRMSRAAPRQAWARQTTCPTAHHRAIVFALCYFHAALLERKTFGVGNLPHSTSGLGWNMNYPCAQGAALGGVVPAGHAQGLGAQHSACRGI